MDGCVRNQKGNCRKKSVRREDNKRKDERDGDIEKGKRIIANAKMRRVSVCNALDCLLVHRHRATEWPHQD